MQQYYTLQFYFPYLSLLAQPINITLYGPGLDCLVFDSVPEHALLFQIKSIILQIVHVTSGHMAVYGPVRHQTHIIWTSEASVHIIFFGSYGSIWTGPSPTKYYMDLRSFGPYNILLVTNRSIYCHVTLSAMNYLLFKHQMVDM